MDAGTSAAGEAAVAGAGVEVEVWEAAGKVGPEHPDITRLIITSSVMGGT